MKTNILFPIILLLISSTNSNQISQEDNFTVNAFETVRAVVLGEPIVSCRLVKYEKLDTILNPNTLLSLLHNIEKYRYRCEFTIDTIYGNQISDSILVITDEGSLRRHDNKLNEQTWFIIRDKDTFEVLSDLRCGKEQYSVVELIRLTQELLKDDKKKSNNQRKSAILPAIKEIQKTRNGKQEPSYDSILTLIQQCSYQMAPEFPDSLDIMYHDPFVWIHQGLRIAAKSTADDLQGFALLLECYPTGKCKCLRSTDPNQNRLSKMVSYIDTAHFMPWIDQIADIYSPFPITILVSWSDNSCYMERLMEERYLKKEDSRLFVRKWKAFPYFKDK